LPPWDPETDFNGKCIELYQSFKIYFRRIYLTRFMLWKLGVVDLVLRFNNL
jgi:hypothetical protein